MTVEAPVESVTRKWSEVELVCVLCGLITVYRYVQEPGEPYPDCIAGGAYPAQCAANAGGDHLRPGDDPNLIESALELRRAWFRQLTTP